VLYRYFVFFYLCTQPRELRQPSSFYPSKNQVPSFCHPARPRKKAVVFFYFFFLFVTFYGEFTYFFFIYIFFYFLIIFSSFFPHPPHPTPTHTHHFFNPNSLSLSLLLLAGRPGTHKTWGRPTRPFMLLFSASFLFSSRAPFPPPPCFFLFVYRFFFFSLLLLVFSLVCSFSLRFFLSLAICIFLSRLRNSPCRPTIPPRVPTGAISMGYSHSQGPPHRPNSPRTHIFFKSTHMSVPGGARPRSSLVTFLCLFDPYCWRSTIILFTSALFSGFLSFFLLEYGEEINLFPHVFFRPHSTPEKFRFLFYFFFFFLFPFVPPPFFFFFPPPFLYEKAPRACHGAHGGRRPYASFVHYFLLCNLLSFLSRFGNISSGVRAPRNLTASPPQYQGNPPPTKRYSRFCELRPVCFLFVHAVTTSVLFSEAPGHPPRRSIIPERHHAFFFSLFFFV